MLSVQSLVARWPRFRQTQANCAQLFCLSVSVPPGGDSGLFWMEWSDFVNIFHDIQVAAKSMIAPRAKFVTAHAT